MKNKLIAPMLICISALLLLCGCKSTQLKEKVITAENLTELCDENGEVYMYMMLSDGWMMNQLAQKYTLTADTIGGVSYKVLSEDVFLWQPSEESMEAPGAQDAVLEAKILLSDPYGRYIVYGPNTENPSDANVLINPDYFSEIADQKSIIIDDAFQFFYKTKEKPLVDLSNSLDLHSFDFAVYYETAN